ncbi:MAG: PEP-CTERM-box response regulator transcription factor, partial [Syntrophobacteraceae bacterium]
REVNSKKLLIVDDDETIRISLKWALSQEYEIFSASNRAEALELFERENPCLVTLDLGLPPDPHGTEEGLNTLASMVEKNQFAKIVVITGQEGRENAIQAIGHGAYDFFQKPIQIEELKIILKRAAYVFQLEEEHRNLQELVADKAFDEILGTSAKIEEIFTTIEKVAGTEVPILILGESGTGKELVARSIHQRSYQKKGPFIAINCGAIPENLLESELFGHEKGAFTGAHAQRKGRVESAEAGTLFLDEIGELPLPLQVKLLRFLQEHKIERVGGRKEIFINTRVIAATNKNLLQEIAEKRFREDLYYRLGVVSIQIPPLRERGEDIPLLATSFLNRYAAENKKKISGFTHKARMAIEGYAWPGNIRELENRIKRAVIMANGSKLTELDLQLSPPGEDGVMTLKKARDKLEKNLITLSLSRNNMNLTRAAAELGISRPTLYELMDRLGIKINQDS